MYVFMYEAKCARFEDLLDGNGAGQTVEIGRLDADRLLEEACGLEVRRIGDERGTLVLVLQGDVLANGTTLEELKAIVFDNVRDFAERLVLQVRGALVLAFREVDGDDFEWHLLLFENRGDAASAAGQGSANEFKDHCCYRLGGTVSGSGRS